jgi:hypothetical protein
VSGGNTLTTCISTTDIPASFNGKKAVSEAVNFRSNRKVGATNDDMAV